MDSYSETLTRVNRETGFSAANRIYVTRLEQDYAEGELHVGPDSLNPHGIVHGGCLSTLADTVGGVAASTRGGHCVTLTSTMQYLKPAVGAVIRCTARPQKVGRTVSVYDARLTDDQGRLVATGVFTYMIIRDRAVCGGSGAKNGEGQNETF